MRIGIISAIIVAIALAGSAHMAAQVPAAFDAEKKQIADFEARVKAYDDLRNKVDGGAAHQTQTKHPERLTAQRDTLRAKIQQARADAKPGDIFTPDIQPLFKRLLKPALKGSDGAENKNTLKEEKPLVELKVNAPYPEKEPLATMPPDILKQLPIVPKNIEYRMVRKHLILYDARASLIVDFIYNAIP
jgi:hypothetical protein